MPCRGVRVRCVMRRLIEPRCPESTGAAEVGSATCTCGDDCTEPILATVALRRPTLDTAVA